MQRLYKVLIKLLSIIGKVRLNKTLNKFPFIINVLFFSVISKTSFVVVITKKTMLYIIL